MDLAGDLGGDGERDGNPVETEPEDERGGCIVDVLRKASTTFSAFKLVVDRPDCSTSPASRTSDPRDAGRETTFCGGIIAALSFHKFGPSLPHNSLELHESGRMPRCFECEDQDSVCRGFQQSSDCNAIVIFSALRYR